MITFATLAVVSIITLSGLDSHVIQTNGPAESTEGVAIGSEQCLMCKEVTKILVKRLKDPKTKIKIENELNQVCDRFLPEEMRPECKQFVNQYTEEIINVLLQESDPKIICNLLGLCTSAVEEEEEISPSVAEGMYCRSCIIGREWISLNVGDNQTREALKSGLDQVCDSVVPKQNVPECKAYIQDRIGYLLTQLETESHPRTFCQNVELCPYQPAMTNPEADGLEREVETDLEAPLPTCFVCKQIMHWLNNELKGNRTEQAIESVMSRICTVFGNKIKNCDEKVIDWSERLAYALKIATDANVACQLLGECVDETNNVERESSSTEMSVKSGEACFECESIAHFIQTELYDYRKEDAIDKWIISTLCDRMNNVMARETCESFIQEYGPSILNLIAQKEFDSKLLCQQELHLCPETSKIAIVPEIELIQIKAGVCDLCISAVERLDSYLASQSTDREIAEVAAQVCDHLEGSRKDECVNIITVYGPYFMQMIGRMNDPRAVCKSVDICQIPGQVHLLGGHKCTFGPTYWCHTSGTAQACQAMDYCTKSVWKPVVN